MSTGKQKREERERFASMPDGDLIELRAMLHREISVLIQQKEKKVGSIKRIDDELANRKHHDAERIVVTDHAVVRYIERLEGRDLEDIRRKIADMARRAIRRDDEFTDDPVTGMIVVRRKGSDSIASIMHGGAEKREPR